MDFKNVLFLQRGITQEPANLSKILNTNATSNPLLGHQLLPPKMARSGDKQAGAHLPYPAQEDTWN